MPPTSHQGTQLEAPFKKRDDSSNLSRDIGIGFGITIGTVLALICIAWTVRIWFNRKVGTTQKRRHIRTESGDDMSYQHEAWESEQEGLRLEMDGSSHPVEAPATPLLTRPPVELGSVNKGQEEDSESPGVGGIMRHITVSVKTDARRWLGGSWISVNG